MNDRLMMENYLLVLKSTVEVYVHGTLESSNSDVRDILFNGLNTILNVQAETYDEMVNFGFYTVSNIKANVIKDTLNKLK